MAVKPIPDGYHTAIPYLTLDDADARMSRAPWIFAAAVPV